MGANFSQRLSRLSEGDQSAIIQMAWEDRTAFETIQERMGWSEAEVIRLMRRLPLMATQIPPLMATSNSPT